MRSSHRIWGHLGSIEQKVSIVLIKVMVINSTNINKTNNHPPLILTELIEHNKNMTYNFGSPGLGQAQKGGWFKLVNSIPTLPSW